MKALTITALVSKDRIMSSPKLFAYLLSIVFALYNTSAAKEKGFVKIFDGKTLNGWQPTKGSENAWHVEDGILVGTGDKGRGYLTYIDNQSIADLEMTFSYRFPGEGNSCLLYTSPSPRDRG